MNLSNPRRSFVIKYYPAEYELLNPTPRAAVLESKTTKSPPSIVAF
jgi:hypothetical protein